MIVYAIAKYLVYSFWCYVGLRMLAGQMRPLRQRLLPWRPLLPNAKPCKHASFALNIDESDVKVISLWHLRRRQ